MVVESSEPEDLSRAIASLLALHPRAEEEPAGALDVAAAVIEGRPGLDQMMLHKLLYLVQAGHLAWYGSPAFKERIEAWTWGPMVRRVAGHYKDFGRRPIMKPVSGDSREIPERVAILVQRVIRRFGTLTGPELADLTKREGSPYQQVWGDRPPDAQSQDEIPLVFIAEFHRLHGLGPEEPTEEERPVIRRYLDGDTGAFLDLVRAVNQ